MYRVGSGPFVLRIQSKDGRVIRASTGTTVEAIAKEVRQMTRDLRASRDWQIIDGIVGKRLKLSDVFDAYRSNNLAEIRDSLSDVDLDPLVKEWAKHATAKYVTQVRVFIPAAQRFPSSRFRRKAISQFLAGLLVSGSTRNRYKAALSVFAKWLVEREVIDTNPVRDVKSAKPNPARMVWLETKDAKKLIAALPAPYKALEALMAGTGMEWSAIANTRRSDVDTATRKIHAQGTKNTHRNRVVRVTEDWTWPIISGHLKTLHPNSLLFDGMSQDYALDVHQATCKAVGLPASTLHDWRHTFAVNALKGGMSPAVVKRQLGHAPNSTVVERVYGVWIVDDSDYSAKRRKA